MLSTERVCPAAMAKHGTDLSAPFCTSFCLITLIALTAREESFSPMQHIDILLKNQLHYFDMTPEFSFQKTSIHL